MPTIAKDTKIAITGGAGYIGSFTTKYLLNSGFTNLVILDNFSTGHKSSCFTRFYEVDLLNKSKLEEIFKKEQFEAVIHFAALIVVPHSMEDPYRYFHQNLMTSLNLLEAMKNNNVSNIVFSSTCAVYGTPKNLPILENESIKPESIYAETKSMIENMIIWYSRLFDIKYTILRYFNACGASPDGTLGEDHNPETHLIPCAIVSLLAGKPIEVYGDDYPTPDKTCIRDYIHVLDLASAHHLALKYIAEEGGSGIFNLGVGRGYSNLEIVKAIASEAKKHDLPAPYEFKPRRSGDVPVLYADNSKAKKVLKWQPQHLNIGKIVEEAFNWHFNRYKNEKDPKASL